MFKNLQSAFTNKSPDWYSQTTKESYKFLINNFVQFLAFPKTYQKSNIQVVGQNILDDTFQKGNGIIFVSGHFGAWEMLAAWLSDNNYPITTVAARQANAGSDRFFRELREQFGMKHIYRKASLDNMYEILERKKILGLVSDQDAKNRGVFVNFFGQQTSTPKGAARFSLNTKTPIIFTFCRQESKNQYKIEFIPVETGESPTIESITQAYTSILEDTIRQAPEQYFWFHRRWKTKSPNKALPKRINVNHPDALKNAADILAEGGIIIYPTDTLYGFGVDATNNDAIDKLNHIKGRSGPIGVIAPDQPTALNWMLIPKSEKDKVAPYLGGMQTIIAPVMPGIVSNNVVGANNSLGIRIPKNQFCNDLAKHFGKPITSTSVNRSGEIPLNNPALIEKEFGYEIELIIDGGTLAPSAGSTIYKLEGKKIITLRK